MMATVPTKNMYISVFCVEHRTAENKESPSLRVFEHRVASCEHACLRVFVCD